MVIVPVFDRGILVVLGIPRSTRATAWALRLTFFPHVQLSARQDLPRSRSPGHIPREAIRTLSRTSICSDYDLTDEKNQELKQKQ